MKVGDTCLKGHPNKHSIRFKSLFMRHLNKESRKVKKACYIGLTTITYVDIMPPLPPWLRRPWNDRMTWTFSKRHLQAENFCYFVRYFVQSSNFGYHNLFQIILDSTEDTVQLKPC